MRITSLTIILNVRTVNVILIALIAVGKKCRRCRAMNPVGFERKKISLGRRRAGG